MLNDFSRFLERKGKEAKTEKESDEWKEVVISCILDVVKEPNDSNED
jgi:hypothetical protein